MAHRVCVIAKGFRNPGFGGLMWMFLNWILGFRELGWEAYWLDEISIEPDDALQQLSMLRNILRPYGLGDSIVAFTKTGTALPQTVVGNCLSVPDVADSDLLVSMSYGAPQFIVNRFKRSVLIDTDPGLLQLWVSEGHFEMARYDLFFTIGENFGRSGLPFPNLGLTWHQTRACVSLPYWPVTRTVPPAAFTTVSNWRSLDWLNENGELVSNEKRTAFLSFVELPQHTSQILELALPLRPKEDGTDRKLLEQNGWRLSDARVVAATPEDSHRYILNSLGEFSCAKPAYVRFENAWVSDRTVCYLGCGKPVVVQHTGASSYLPDAEGLFRFRTMEEAANSLEKIARDYEHQCDLARALAAEFFDAKKVLRDVLEKALT